MSVDRITILRERTRKKPAKITFHYDSLKIEGPYRTWFPLFNMCVGDDETARITRGFSICRIVQSIGCVISLLFTLREQKKEVMMRKDRVKYPTAKREQLYQRVVSSHQ